MFRSFRAHVAGHNWFAAAIDIVVLIAGIFLGLQANNWNQAKIDRSKGHEYRRRLVNEIRADEIQLASRRRYFNEVRRHAKQALSALERPAAEADTAFLIDAYQASQITPIRPARAAYEEIVSTGNFENLGDASLREQVASYYIVQESTAQILDFVPPYREHLRQLMPSPAQEAIRAQCAEKWHLGATGVYRLELPVSCALILDPAAILEATAAVRASSDLAKELTRVVADVDVKLTVVHSLSIKARIVRRKILEAGDHW